MKALTFAAVAADQGLASLTRLTPGVKESLIVLGAVLFVVGAAIFWVLIIRKQKRRPSRRHQRHSTTPAPAGVIEIQKMVRDRNRRRRRKHRPRNPTLAETGGLPPPRTHAPSGLPPAPPQT